MLYGQFYAVFTVIMTTYQLIFIQPFLDLNPVPKTYTNSADSVQTPQNAASDQGLRCLLTGISTIQ